MGEDAFVFGGNSFPVMGISSRSMDDYKSTTSSTTESTRSSKGSRERRTSSSSSGDRHRSSERERSVRKSSSGEGLTKDRHHEKKTEPERTPAIAAPPERGTRSRRRASIGVPAAMPPQLAPVTDIQNHFDNSNSNHGGNLLQQRSRSADDVMSTASGFKNKRAQNVRRAGRRASLATTRPGLDRATSAPISSFGDAFGSANAFGSSNAFGSNDDGFGSNNDGFGSSDPFGKSDPFATNKTNNKHDGFDYEPQGGDYGYGYDQEPHGADATADYGYGYEDAAPKKKNDFGNFGAPASTSAHNPRPMRRASALGAIRAPKKTEPVVPAPTPATSSAIDDLGLDPFDFSTTTSAPSAASRTQNIMLPTMAAPLDKAQRPRRRASLMGNIGGAISGTVGAISGTVGAIGDVGGALTGAVTGSNKNDSGEKLSDDKKSKKSSSKTSSSSKASRRKSTTVESGGGIGISAYDADRDRRRYLG